MGIRVSVVQGGGSDDGDCRQITSSSSSSSALSGPITTLLTPYNYAIRGIPPSGTELLGFVALPPEPPYLRLIQNPEVAAARPEGRLVWSVDAHFAPRSECQLLVCFAAHVAREGMSPAPVDSHLSGGRVCRWRLESSRQIACSPVRSVQSVMTFPCQIAPHPSRPLIVYAGHYGLTSVDLESGATRHNSECSLGEVVKSLALSPDGRRILALIRISHGFHLRVIRGGGTSENVVEDEVRLTKLIPCLRLGRAYTETGHCTWSPDSCRVAFASSTGHYGVLSLLGRRQLHLEFVRRPAAAVEEAEDVSALAELSSPRAFAFCPLPTNFVVAFAVGGTIGCVDLVVGEVLDSGSECDDSGTTVYRRVLRVPLSHRCCDSGEQETVDVRDVAEVLAFGQSGRLLAAGCRSGRVHLWECNYDHKLKICLQPLHSLDNQAAASASVTSLTIADTESLLAAGDTRGRVRVWRVSLNGTVESLTLLCRRAIAARCRVDRVGELPLPASLLAGVCVNRLDREALRGRAVAAAETKTFHITLF